MPAATQLFCSHCRAPITGGHITLADKNGCQYTGQRFCISSQCVIAAMKVLERYNGTLQNARDFHARQSDQKPT